MSDSDNDLSNNVFSFQFNNTMLVACGPSSNASTTGVGLRHNSVNPMHISRGMSSQRSTYNGRCASPMSVRTVDSCTSVIASDIVKSIRHEELDEFDLKMISEALKKRMKHEFRGKIEKLRKIRRLPKKPRYRCDDSTESDSSISSDDMSGITENMSSCRSTKTISNFRHVQDRNMFKDTGGFEQSCWRGTNGPACLNNTQTSMLSSHRNGMMGSNMSNMNLKNMQHSRPNFHGVLQKDRFRSGVLLPSQRFNRSVASSVIPEHAETANHCRSNMFNRNAINERKDANSNIDSKQDDTISKQRSNNTQRKRNIDNVDDISLPNQKRPKTPSTCKNSFKDTIANDNNETNDFIFAKPANPIRKPSYTKKEIIISKSLGSILDSIVQPSVIPPVENINECNYTLEQKKDTEEPSDIGQSTSDLSMKPSFMKRKLFTQKLDITEQKNLNSDNLVESPNTSIYSQIQKEKHKARKLQQVKTQSCLSRDVLQDESDLQDLIHKIVPPMEMNTTNQTNRSEIQNRKQSDGSDTYTDEEIFNMTAKEHVSQVAKAQQQKIKDCTVDPENLPATDAVDSNTKLASKQNITNCKLQTTTQQRNCIGEKTVLECVRSFWDTDYESDADYQQKHINSDVNKTHQEDTLVDKEVSQFRGFATKFNFNNKTNALPNNISSLHKSLHNTVAKEHVSQAAKAQQQKIKDCTVNPENLPATDAVDSNRKLASKQNIENCKLQTTTQQRNCIGKKTVLERVRSFWDTDYESDADHQQQHINGDVNKTHQEDTLLDKEVSQLGGFATKFNSNNKTNALPNNNSSSLHNTVGNVKFNNMSLKISSHRAPKRKESKNENVNSFFEQQNKKQKTAHPSYPELMKVNTNQQSDKQKQKSKEAVPQQNNKEKTKVKNKMNTSPIDQENESTKEKPTQASKKNIKTTQSKESKTNRKETNSAQDTKTTTLKDKSANTLISKKNCKGLSKNNKKQEQIKNTLSSKIEKKPLDNSKQNNNNTKKCKTQNKKETPKTKKTSKLKHNSIANLDTTMEEEHKSQRPVRSCRNSSLSVTHNSSNSVSNSTLCRTLRSRQIYLSSSQNGNTTKSVDTKNATWLSDVSFSLTAEKKPIPKRDVSKITSFFKPKQDIDTSDISFSLRSIESPTPKKALSVKSRNPTKKEKYHKKSTPVKKNLIQSKEMFISKNETKPIRNKLPNKRYLIW